MLERKTLNYYNEIKTQIINNELSKKLKDYSKNKSDLQTYYNIGKLLTEAGKHYGEGIIKKYSDRLTKEFGKGYTQSRLRYFRRFYEVFSKCPTLSDELTYSHYCEIIWLEEEQLNYYINICKKYHLSVRKLRYKVKIKEYERLSEETKYKLINKDEQKVSDLIKNPIIIKNNNNYEIISEKMLQKLILEDIPSFLKELGSGFTFIENEYRIKLGDKYNYIDLLLFNYEYNCFVVIELKVIELKKEHIGQIHVYMNYIDNNLRKINQDKTIGIIIVRKNNKYVMEYCSDDRIIAKEYEII